MPSRKLNRSEKAPLSPKEEMLLVLFRDLTRHQQREVITELQAMHEANQMARSEMKHSKLDAVSNEEVRARFKDVPPSTVRKS